MSDRHFFCGFSFGDGFRPVWVQTVDRSGLQGPIGYFVQAVWQDARKVVEQPSVFSLKKPKPGNGKALQSQTRGG